MSALVETARQRRAIPKLHRSVSLEADHGSAGTTRPFILTGCAHRALARIIEGIISPNSPRAWTLTGPFGTGKSSFCLFLSRLLAVPASHETKQARRFLKDADVSLVATLRSAVGEFGGLVPIVITGARESFGIALTRGLLAALDGSAAKGAGRLAGDLRKDSASAKRDPLLILERVVSCLMSDVKAMGVVLVLDELGKLLEYAAAHPSQSDVYVLQRIAEHAARADHPFLVVGVLHQDFSGYTQELPETERREWEKVRGRFEDVIFEQSADDMLRLIAEAMCLRRNDEKFAIGGGRVNFKSLCEVAWAAEIVPPGLERSRGLPLLTACYPLHPCVTLLLGPIFKRFGQNERSAFSFLTSGEPYGLVDFALKAQEGDLYSIVHLYQYLVGVFGDSLLSSRDGKRWAEAFNVEAQHPDLTREELSLLRTIALLAIVGRWNGASPTPQVLAFALSSVMSKADVERATKSLLAKSAIVYRRFNNTYNLWEGSDIDVESLVADARSRIAGDAATVQLLRAHFSPRPLVARRHSFESGTLRYFDVVFATGATLGDTVATFDSAADGKRADGRVIVLLPDARDGSANSVAAAILARTARPDTVLCVPGNAQEVESLARELAAVQWVCKATGDLQNDATARRELAAREQNVHHRLEHALAEILAPTRSGRPQTRWYRMSKELNLTTPRALNELLSTICDKVFASAPQIQNEIINRRELSSSAAAAQGNLIDHMVRHASVDGLAINGNPPERSIYLSVLRTLKLHQEHHGQWAFASSEKNVRPDAKAAYKAIRVFFDSADCKPHGLDELFAQLRQPPFGLRNGVIPIFVCAALLGSEADVAVYEDGAFLPQLTDAVFEKLVKEPARYTIRRWHVSGVRVAVFDQLGKMLGQSPVTDNIEPRDLLDVVKPLVRFIRKLTDFTRETKTFAPVTIAVREAIANASEPDQLLFRDLPLACGIQPFTGSRKDRSEDIAHFLRELQGALGELQRGYEALLHSLTGELARSLGISDSDAMPRGKLTKRAASVIDIALSPEIKVFSARLADVSADDTAWVEQIASFLTNKHPALWHDDERGRFSVRLTQMAEALQGLESLVMARRDLQRGDEGNESIRISVVGTRWPQAERVVHLSPQEVDQVKGLESKLRGLFEPYSRNGSRKLVIAALARITQAVLSVDPATSSQHEGSTK